MTEGVKFDGEKPTTDLLPFDSLLGVADVLRYGKAKYAARNWENGMAWGRLLGAGLRHAFAWAMGQDKDPESGLHHLAHACCCFLMLYALVLRRVGTDDRAGSPGMSTDAVASAATIDPRDRPDVCKGCNKPFQTFALRDGYCAKCEPELPHRV